MSMQTTAATQDQNDATAQLAAAHDKGCDDARFVILFLYKAASYLITLTDLSTIYNYFILGIQSKTSNNYTNHAARVHVN